MKKVLLFITFMIGMLTVHAEEYAYLTFETTDGAKISVPASSLTITISGTTLTAGTQSFTLSNLDKMYFSTSDLTSGIESLENVRLTIDEATDIYDLQGRKVSKDQLRSGQVYIVKTKSGIYKIAMQ